MCSRPVRPQGTSGRRDTGPGTRPTVTTGFRARGWLRRLSVRCGRQDTGATIRVKTKTVTMAVTAGIPATGVTRSASMEGLTTDLAIPAMATTADTGAAKTFSTTAR